jgi:hypothetical protein
MMSSSPKSERRLYIDPVNIPVALRYESLSSAGDVSPKKRSRM